MSYEDARNDAAVGLAIAIERQRRLVEMLEQSGSTSAAEAAKRVLVILENALSLIAPLAT